MFRLFNSFFGLSKEIDKIKKAIEELKRVQAVIEDELDGV